MQIMSELISPPGKEKSHILAAGMYFSAQLECKKESPFRFSKLNFICFLSPSSQPVP